MKGSRGITNSSITSITRAIQLKRPWISPISHLPGRKLPDKAIDVIDEAGARIRLRAQDNSKKTVHVSDIESVVAAMAQILTKSITADDRRLLQI
ncbi:MAG: hypothetical protein R3B54_00255 [Bdellovibrionota bacterium]